MLIDHCGEVQQRHSRKKMTQILSYRDAIDDDFEADFAGFVSIARFRCAVSLSLFA
jgi:hypothetical protein